MRLENVVKPSPNYQNPLFNQAIDLALSKFNENMDLCFGIILPGVSTRNSQNK